MVTDFKRGLLIRHCDLHRMSSTSINGSNVLKCLTQSKPSIPSLKKKKKSYSLMKWGFKMWGIVCIFIDSIFLKHHVFAEYNHVRCTGYHDGLEWYQPSEAHILEEMSKQISKENRKSPWDQHQEGKGQSVWWGWMGPASVHLKGQWDFSKKMDFNLRPKDSSRYFSKVIRLASVLSQLPGHFFSQ